MTGKFKFNFCIIKEDGDYIRTSKHPNGRKMTKKEQKEFDKFLKPSFTPFKSFKETKE